MVGVCRDRLAVGTIVILFASALAIVSPGTAYAANYSFTVIGPGDGVGNCNPDTHRCTTLRAAFTFANDLLGTNTVSVTIPADTYGLHLGELMLTQPGLTFNLTGAGAGTTVVERASTAAPARILDTCAPSNAPPPAQPCLAGPTVNLAGITIQNGRVVDAAGAGIRNGGGNMSLTNVVVRANAIAVTNGTANAPHGSAGGGIFNNGRLTVTTSTVSGNSVTMTGTEFGVVFGAGIASRNGELTVDESTVSDNVQTACANGDVCGGGAAAINARGGSLTITNSAVSGNIATNQGSSGVSSFAGNVATITNTTISGNAASGPGTAGGGFFRLGPGSTTFTSVTISGNSALDGGGIRNFSAPDAVTVKNSIIANNAGGNCSGAVTSGGYNLDSGDSCQFNRPGDLSNTDPGLGRLQDNGGPTQTEALMPGSPAIDAVGNEACPPPTTDQRGVTRPQGPRCDVGAFEVVQPSSP